MNILNVLRVARSRLAGLHHDEQGDEGVNKILIIALVAIPLIIVMVVFGGDIADWFNDAWKNIQGEKGTIKKPTAPGATT